MSRMLAATLTATRSAYRPALQTPLRAMATSTLALDDAQYVHATSGAPETPIVVHTTTANDADARKVANALIEQDLAACVQLIPQVRSLYKWQGRVEDDAEVLIQIKSVQRHAEAIATAVRKVHPYDEPELLVLEANGASRGYGDWINDVTRK